MTWRLRRKANKKWWSKDCKRHDDYKRLGKDDSTSSGWKRRSGSSTTTTKTAEGEDHTGMRNKRTRYGPPMKWKYLRNHKKSVSRTLKQLWNGNYRTCSSSWAKKATTKGNCSCSILIQCMQWICWSPGEMILVRGSRKDLARRAATDRKFACLVCYFWYTLYQYILLSGVEILRRGRKWA